MIMEYKYYLEKFNKMLEDEENQKLISTYLNTNEIKENPIDYKISSEVKKNILMFLSSNNNSLFSKNYTQNIINSIDNIEAKKQNIINKDIENQEENFKQRLKGKILKTRSTNNNINYQTDDSLFKNKYLPENIFKIERKQTKIEEKYIKYVNTKLFGKIILNRIDLEVDKIFDFNQKKYKRLVQNFELKLNKTIEENLGQSINNGNVDSESIPKDREAILFCMNMNVIKNIKSNNINEFMNNKELNEISNNKNVLIDSAKKSIDFLVKKNNLELFKKSCIRTISSTKFSSFACEKK